MSEISAAAGPTTEEAPAAPASESLDCVARPGYFRIENDFVDCYAERIGAIPVAVRVVVGRFADNKTGRCYPSTRTIAETLHLSQKTVLKAIRTLEKEGLIKVERRRTTRGERLVNVYTLLPVRGAALVTAPVLDDVQHRAGGGSAEQDLINKTQENKRERAPAPRAPAPCAPAPCAPAQRPPAPALRPHEHVADEHPRDPNLEHPAVVAYRETCKTTPNETQAAEIAATVTDVPKWQEVMRWWLLKDYRKTNVADMLDRYQKGMPEGGGGNGGNGAGRRPGFQGNRVYDRPESRPPETPDERARRDAEFNALKQSHNRSQHGQVSCS